jgi:hypothetical protein
MRSLEGGVLGHRFKLMLLAVAVGGAAAPTGWIVTDRLERENAFCTSCHLEPSVPLHDAKRSDFERRPPLTLVAAHGLAGVEDGGRRDFRCIDCHGGVGPLGRLRVKVLSARDGFWYAVGAFDEPDHMRWPLLDADCRQCHATFEERGVTPGRDPLFHELSAHNTALGVACVDCHLAHDEGGLPGYDFLQPDAVRARCAECHPEFE